MKLINEDANYVASYYQLRKLHESLNEVESAMKIYKKGIEIAQKMNNKKTLLELQEAYNLLIVTDEDESDSYWI